MTHGCIVAAALAVIAGSAFSGTAEAACDQRNLSACERVRPAASKPLQLNRFMALGPARRTGRRTGAGRATGQARAAPAGAVGAAPLAPKPIQTLSIAAPAIALAPAGEDRTVGFAAATERWSGETAFASADEPAASLPPGIAIAASDEVNEIDLAADAEPRKSDRFGQVALVTPANAMPTPAPAGPEPAIAKPEERSWFAWAYGKLIDGLLTAALALRSLFA